MRTKNSTEAKAAEARSILRTLIPFLTNKEILDYTGLPSNYIYEKIGKTNRRKVKTGLNIEVYANKLEQLVLLYSGNEHEGTDVTVKPKKVIKHPQTSDNDQKHIMETCRSPFNLLHTRVWI